MPTKEELERKNIEAERSERELEALMGQVVKAKNGETLIHFLAKENRKELLKLLLPRMSPAVLNTADKEGRTALHYAAKTGNKEALQLLLNQKGIDGNKVDEFGNTPLHLASANGNVDIVALLWSKKEIDIKKTNNLGKTALDLAAHNKKKDLLELLRLDRYNDKDIYRVFSLGVYKGNMDILELLLPEMTPEVINQADKDGQTVLHFAARNGYKDIVGLLMAKDGIDGNKADRWGNTPLHYAAEMGHKDVIEILLNKGADVNQANNIDGHTALHSAAANGHTKLVKWMIEEKGAAVNQAHKHGETALHLAANLGDKDLAKLLIESGKCDLNAALHWAVYDGRKDIVELLLAKDGIDVNKADKEGRTALHFAARLGHHDTVELLIKSGKCDLNAKDTEGNDIWAYYPPEEESSREMVELLMKHGAKYPEPRRSDGELAKIVSSSQAAHSQGKLAQDEYNKFKEGKDDANIKAQLEAQANEFIELLNAAHLSLNEEYHIKMVKDLIAPKYADITQGQGADFIKKVGKICGLEESQLNPEILKSAIDNLSEDKKKELAKYSQDKIDETISYYTTKAIKPFHGFDITTKDFFGVFGAKIADKIEKKEDIGDILPNTLKEILDAGTMYGSGGASCATGMVNKMFNSSPQLFEDKSEILSKGEFEFEGFVVDYEALLTVATMKLEDSKEEELVEKILGQSELTQLEVQKVGAKVYEILKETKNDGNLVEGYKTSWTFSEIIYYGGEENVFSKDEKIEQFCKAIGYKTLSDQTYSGIFKKHGEKYEINKDKVIYPVIADDLEPSKLLNLNSKKEIDSIIEVLSGHIPESGSSQNLPNQTSKDQSRGRG